MSGVTLTGAQPFVRRHDVERHSDDQVIGEHPGKVDAGEMACLAGATVGADKVLRRQIVGAIRAGDMYRDAVVVLVETRQSVTPTHVRLVFAGPLGKHLQQAPAVVRGSVNSCEPGTDVRSKGKPANIERGAGFGGSAVPVSTLFRPR